MNDFILDENNDLAFENGELKWGDSTLQNQKLLFITQKGEWKANGAVGIGADDYVDDDDLVGLENEIKSQFEADGMTIETLAVFEDGSVNVKANYEG